MTLTTSELTSCYKWICERGQNFQSRGQMHFERTGQAHPLWTYSSCWMLKIAKSDMDNIKNNRKHIEARVAYGSIKRILPGDTLRLQCEGLSAKTIQSGVHHVEVKVLTAVKYETFRSMLQKEGINNCFPDCTNISTAVDAYHSVRGYEQMAKTNGVIAFRITTNLRTEPPNLRFYRRVLEETNNNGRKTSRSRSRRRHQNAAKLTPHPHMTPASDALTNEDAWLQ